MADVKTDSISSTEFGKLFFEFKPRFIALAYRYVRDRETAEDLVSDSFMTFWEMHETLPADINVPAYILTSVKNRCLNHLNAQIRHRKAEHSIQRYEGALHGEQVVNQNIASKDTSVSFPLPVVSRFNASYASALYQDGLSEIRVNALFGLNLIRAY